MFNVGVNQLDFNNSFNSDENVKLQYEKFTSKMNFRRTS